MRPEELLSFLHLAARLKDRTRHNSDGKGRSESVADHCWLLALLADLLRPEFPALNMDRVVRLCLIHDLGEAVTGDIPTFEKTAADEAEEERAIFTFLDPLPEPERGTLRALFEEALALKTPESRLCKALDKLEAVIAHNEAPLSTWIPLEYDLQRTYGWKEAEFSPYLTALREAVLRETEERSPRANQKGAALPCLRKGRRPWRSCCFRATASSWTRPEWWRRSWSTGPLPRWTAITRPACTAKSARSASASPPPSKGRRRPDRPQLQNAARRRNSGGRRVFIGRRAGRTR